VAKEPLTTLDFGHQILSVKGDLDTIATEISQAQKAGHGWIQVVTEEGDKRFVNSAMLEQINKVTD
jgi:hypothetical protein